MSKQSAKLQEAHNAGQTDAAEGRNDPPHSFIDRLKDNIGETFGGGHVAQDHRDEQAAYNKGRENGHRK